MQVQDYEDMLIIAVDSLTMIVMNEVDSAIEEAAQAINEIIKIKEKAHGRRCDQTRDRSESEAIQRRVRPILDS